MHQLNITFLLSQQVSLPESRLLCCTQHPQQPLSPTSSSSAEWRIFTMCIFLKIIFSKYDRIHEDEASSLSMHNYDKYLSQSNSNANTSGLREERKGLKVWGADACTGAKPFRGSRLWSQFMENTDRLDMNTPGHSPDLWLTFMATFHKNTHISCNISANASAGHTLVGNYFSVGKRKLQGRFLRGWLWNIHRKLLQTNKYIYIYI